MIPKQNESKFVKFFRLLNSDNDAEALAALRMARRFITEEKGINWNVFVDGLKRVGFGQAIGFDVVQQTYTQPPPQPDQTDRSTDSFADIFGDPGRFAEHMRQHAEGWHFKGSYTDFFAEEREPTMNQKAQAVDAAMANLGKHQFRG